MNPEIDHGYWPEGIERPIPVPVPAKGALGLWRPPADLVRSVYAQLEVA